jgi:PAS domain S-box-containing protein
VLEYASRAEAVFQAAPDAIVGIDASGLILLVNTQAERLFDYDCDELINQPVEVIVPEAASGGLYPARRTDHIDDTDHARRADTSVMLAGRRKGGGEFPAEISLSVVNTEDGPVVAAAVHDISGRKDAEAKFRWMIEVAPDAILGVDASGSIELVNAQCEHLVGRSRDDLVGRPIEVVLPGGLRPVDAGQVGACVVMSAVHEGGTTIPVEVSLSALETTTSGRLTMAAVRDISDRKHIEHLLQHNVAELERANQVKNNLLASMSHELRTPLNAILGFTGTLLMRLPGPLNAEQEHQLQLVKASGGHLLSIINDLLDLAKIESGRVEIALVPVDCRAVVEDVVQSLRPLAETHGVTLRVEGPDAPVFATADERALSQIVVNLVNNAIKFAEASQVHIRLAPHQPGGRIQLSVHDTGPGIPQADLDRIFHAFERSAATAKATDEGTGLGLHISRKLAELMNATVTVSSVVGEGSTFTISLATDEKSRS